jgi:hypothetical protein
MKHILYFLVGLIALPIIAVGISITCFAGCLYVLYLIGQYVSQVCVSFFSRNGEIENAGQ